MLKKEYFIAIGLGIVSFLYYFWQSCPVFYFWDSAELATVIACRGIPHPPAFPLYLLTAGLLDLVLPFDSGRTTTLFSVLCVSISIGLFYLCTWKLLNIVLKPGWLRRFCAFVVTFGLILSHSLSAQATRAEVYALNFLIYSLALFFISDIFLSPQNPFKKKRVFILALYLIGLGLANHHFTIALLLPATFYLGFKERFNLSVISTAIISVVFPLSIYLLLIIYAGHKPDLNWGNPTNLVALVDVFILKGFTRSIEFFRPGHILDNFIFDISLIFKQTGPVLALFSIIGLVAMAKTNRRLFFFLAIILFFNLISTIFNETYYYENMDIHGYLLFSVAVVMVFSAIGLGYTVLWMSRKYRTIVLLPVGILAIAVPGYANFKSADLSNNYSAKELSTILVDECAQDAVVFTSSYNTYFLIKAIQNVYGYRKDLKVFNVYLFEREWYRNYASDRFKMKYHSSTSDEDMEFYRYLMNTYKDSSEIYIEYDEKSLPLRNYLWPEGMFMKFKNERFDPDSLNKGEFFREDIKRFGNYFKYGTDYEEFKSIIWFVHNRGLFFKAHGQGDLAEMYFGEVEKVTVSFLEKKDRR